MADNNFENDIIEFNATITFKKYYSHDSSWGVFIFSTEDDIPHSYGSDGDKVFGTLAGRMQELMEGCTYLVKATFKNNAKYGDQYNPIAVYAVTPKNEEQQLVFLKTLVSETIAKNLLTVYPNIVNDVIEGKVDKIEYSKVKGVGEITWLKIKNKILDNYLISDIISLLQPIGVTFNMIKKLLEDQPNPSLLKDDLLNNPYILTRVKGLGFKKVDRLALSLKPKMRKSKERLTAFVNYYFREIGDDEGHTWVSEQILKNAVSNNIPECDEYMEWLLTNSEFLHIEDNKVGLKKYYDTEQAILNRLIEKSYILTKIQINKEVIERAISEAEKEQGFKYVKEQIEAIYNVLNNTVSLIVGKAGTGKSSIMRAIIKAYTLKGYKVAACALSAMASQRITEAADYPAMTIHRTLECIGLNKFQRNEDYPILADAVFMDEGSMTNASLFLHWLKAIDKNTRVIISGDHKQLPPIGYGNIFSDLIDKLPENCINALVKPMRQAQLSGILSDANLIRENINPVTEGMQAHLIHGELKDMHYMFRENRESLFNIAVKMYMKSIHEVGIDNVVIATPRKQGCLNSTIELNKRIQDLLLPDVNEKVVTPKLEFKLGTKVLQTVNDYDRNIFNGDVGYITRIFKQTEDNKIKPACEVKFNLSNGEEKIVEYVGKELLQLDLAYAMTVHKLQGSGKHTVIGIVDNTHFKLLDNCMLYTMLTRAKKRCLLLAEPQAFTKCMRTSHNMRNTWLAERS